RLAIEVDRYLGVLEPDFLDECAQALQRRFGFLDRTRPEFLVVDRQNERRRARLLLSELRQVTVAGDAEDLHALFFDRGGNRADAESRVMLGPKVFGAV